MLLRVTFGAFDFRQSNRRRRVGKGKPNKDDASEGDRRRNEEGESPTDNHEISTKNDNQSAADRMRDIPDRHSTSAGRSFASSDTFGRRCRHRAIQLEWQPQARTS